MYSEQDSPARATRAMVQLIAEKSFLLTTFK